MYGVNANNLQSIVKGRIAQATLNLLVKNEGVLGDLSQLTAELNHLDF